MDIFLVPIGKVFHYQGKQWKKVNLLPGQISRAVLCIEKDEGLFTVDSTIIDLESGTQVDEPPKLPELPAEPIKPTAPAVIRKPRRRIK